SNIVITAYNVINPLPTSLPAFSITVASSGNPITVPVGGLGMTFLTTLVIAGYGYWKSRR
ncbi:MAG: hypothetical protein ABSA86_11285, partial [Oryzomonas sp.]